MQITGRVWKYGDNVNTDVIFPGKYTYTITDPQEMAQYALEDLDPSFTSKVRKGDVLVVGKNFGCGSSREQAVTCLKMAGIGAIIGKSFARIYFRNAVNNGLLLIESAGAADAIQEGDTVTVDTEAGMVECAGKTFSVPPLPQFILDIMDDGGLIPHTRKKLGLA